MSLLENIREQKINKLKEINANIAAIINEYEPQIEQLESEIEELTDMIGDGAGQEEPQQ